MTIAKLCFHFYPCRSAFALLDSGTRVKVGTLSRDRAAIFRDLEGSFVGSDNGPCSPRIGSPPVRLPTRIPTVRIIVLHPCPIVASSRNFHFSRNAPLAPRTFQRCCFHLMSSNLFSKDTRTAFHQYLPKREKDRNHLDR